MESAFKTIVLDCPKSQMETLPVEDIRILLGLMSRCMIFDWCIKFMAHRTL